MEYEEYVNLHKMFGKCDGEEILVNPHYYGHQYGTTYNKDTGVVTSSWFRMTETEFAMTQTYNSPYNIGFSYAYTEVPLKKLFPKQIVVEYLSATEFTVNGHRGHQGLVINHLTGLTKNFNIAAYPHTEEDKKKAVSTLRKHVTKYKKVCRPIYRLLEGSLTANDDKKLNTGWSNRKYDDLDTHELYEMLRKGKPTPDDIMNLMDKGNSSTSYGSYISHSNFEASISRVIQRRRKDLQSFALLEANNEYKQPIQKELTNGRPS